MNETSDFRASESRKLRLLVHSQLIGEQDLQADIEEAARTGVSTAYVLMSRHHISKGSIGYALHVHYQRPFLDAEGLEPSREAALQVGREHLKAHCWLPLVQVGDVAHVWTDDPSSPSKLEAIRQALPGRSLRVYVGLREDILRAVESLRLEADPSAPALRRATRWLALAAALLAAEASAADWADQLNWGRRNEAARAESVASAAWVPLEYVQVLRESGLSWEHIVGQLGLEGPASRPDVPKLFNRFRDASGGGSAAGSRGGGVAPSIIGGGGGGTTSGGCRRRC